MKQFHIVKKVCVCVCVATITFQQMILLSQASQVGICDILPLLWIASLFIANTYAILWIGEPIWRWFAENRLTKPRNNVQKTP